MAGNILLSSALQSHSVKDLMFVQRDTRLMTPKQSDARKYFATHHFDNEKTMRQALLSDIRMLPAELRIEHPRKSAFSKFTAAMFVSGRPENDLSFLRVRDSI